MDDGGPYPFSGVILDYNPPDPDHWLFELIEQNRPDNLTHISQPPAVLEDLKGPFRSMDGTRYKLNPKADNLKHLHEMYYPDLVMGSRDDWISVMLMGNYGYLKTGRPVYANYSDDIHYNPDLSYTPGWPLCLGFDFGHNPSAALFQPTPDGRVNVIDELYLDGRGLVSFISEVLKPTLAVDYPQARIVGWGDPAGMIKEQGTEQTCFILLEEAGFAIYPPGLDNNPVKRIAAVDRKLKETINGIPALQVGPKCRRLRAGFIAQYMFERVKKTGQSGMFRDKPLKNLHSHIHEGLQYGVLGLELGGVPDPSEITEALPLDADLGPANEAGY